MQALANLIYLLLFLVFLSGSLIAVFHLVRYSYDKKMTALMVSVFVCVMAILIFINVLLFFSVDFDNLSWYY